MLRIGVLGLATVMVLSGCGNGDSGSVSVGSGGDRGTIGLAMPNKTSPRWISDGENMQKQFKLLGYDSDLQYGNDDPPTQVAQIEAMVAKGDKVLVIAAVDGNSLTAVLQKAGAAHIPVIAYDRLIRDTPNVSYYATFDNFKVGVVQAQAIVSGLGLSHGRGPFNLELFAGSADDNNAHFFFRGSMSVLKPYISSGKLVVRSRQTSFAKVATLRWDGQVAQTRMAKILASKYSSARVDAVLSPYDGLSRGILTALESAGYGTSARPLPVVTGQDAELDSVKLIASGKQTETVYKDTRELAKVAVQMVDSVLKGGTPEINDTTQYNNGVKVVPTFMLQPVGVDKSNYKRILVDGGYYTAAQLGN
jgi:putative multiple sugar transport system substrate-binding protein